LATGTGTAAASAFSPNAEMTGVATGTGAAAAIGTGAVALQGVATGTGEALGGGYRIPVAGTYNSVGLATGSGSAVGRAATEYEDASEVFRLCQLEGISFQAVSNTVVITPEVGEALTRKEYTGDFEDISGTFPMVTRTKAIAIKTFWRDTLRDGSLKFLAEHPVTGEDNKIFMFLRPPEFSRNGHLYNVSILVRKVEE
jgi:hypothetical protein